MSTSSIPAAANAALSSTIPQLHGHGHKRGMQLDALTDSGSTSAGKTPGGSTQDLFGTLLSSLEEVAGITLPKLGQSSQPPAATAQASSVAPSPAGSKLNVTA
jgi:hypothetical protein